MPETEAPAILAIIPARGGSKGVPMKNIAPISGVSLIGRTIEAAARTSRITEIAVSTDHPEIAAEARRFGAVVIERPAEISGDTAGSEAAVLHVLEQRPGSEITVFLQCTSPFIDSEALDAAIARVATGECDTVFSAAEDHGFLWRLDSEGGAEAVGHDAAHRPRRQDRELQLRETGAFYVMRTAGFLENRHRFFGRTGIQQVDPVTAIEIDTPLDLELARLLAAADVQP